MKPLKDVEVTEKQTATFKCTVSKTTIKVTWLKNDKPIKPDDRHEITESGPDHVLTVKRVRPDDQDTYTCTIKDDKTVAKLTVLGKVYLSVKNWYNTKTVVIFCI